MTKRMSAIVLEGLVAILVLLFFSVFGLTASAVKAFHDAYILLIHTFEGVNWRPNYAGLSWSAVFASFRLIAIAVVISTVLGLAYALFSFRLRTRIGRNVNELIASVLQSLPEAMYVIVVFMVLVYLLDHGINLPGLFHDGLPRFEDTFAPALALALPGILYLRGVLMIRLQDEHEAPYVETALAKGLSRRQVFYRHILPNVLPALYRQIAVVAGFAISSALFAEYFLGYMGVLFRFPMFIGWNVTLGAAGLKKPAGVPQFQPGAVWVVGVLLAVLWVVFAVLSEVLLSRVPEELETIPTPTRRKVGKAWIFVGSFFIACVLFFSSFPTLLTKQAPLTEHLINTKEMTFPPYPPSAQYLMGTDMKGRDLLSLTLHATFTTLSEVVLGTILVVFGALALATWLIVSKRSFTAVLATRAGRILSAIPTLLVVILALFHRNFHSPYQELQYLLWIAVFEAGRGGIALYGAMQDWFQFGFIEGATSIGQSRLSILFRQLRSWLGQFTLEFGFSEFTRVLSLMTLLAMYHIYPVEQIVYGKGYTGVEVSQLTWFAVLGDAANQVFSVIAHPFLIYAPVTFLLLTMLGASFIARGFRGGA